MALRFSMLMRGSNPAWRQCALPRPHNKIVGIGSVYMSRGFATAC
jgi:hypothetical protein